MSDPREVTLEQMRAMAERAGVAVGEELGMLVPLMNQILTRLDAVPDALLREVEPLLTHEAGGWGPV